MIAWSDEVRSLRPWMLGALVWAFLSAMVVLEYVDQDEPEYLTQIWFILSLLWWQFCFAGIFSAVRRHQRRRLPGLLLLSLLPPLLLHFLVRLLA